MTLDQKGREFIQQLEGLRLNAYLDGADIPTIGYGTTIYPSGERVKMGDTTTKLHAENYFSHDLIKFESFVSLWTVQATNVDGSFFYPELTQSKFNALVSFTYNVGTNAYLNSTLRKIVNSTQRNDRNLISYNFLSWNKIRKGGILVPSDGLTNRRKKEVELYFS
jgi:lysozyme